MAVQSSSFKTLPQWLAWQESLHVTEIDLGLDRVRVVAERMKLLQPSAKIITVAGTNGKGSCVATLEALFLQAGKTTGAFTSPHFHSYNERIRINGTLVSDSDLCDSFARINTARQDVSLTYFEFGTLAAIDIFQQCGVEVMLLEVGLGGRLDAVNIMPHDVSIVTSIALDHESWLGSDLKVIGREKAGIYRANRPAICADVSAPLSVSIVAEEVGAHFVGVGRDFSWTINDLQTWSWWGLDSQGHKVQFTDLPIPNLPLPSVAAALMAFVFVVDEYYKVDESYKKEYLSESGVFTKLLPDILKGLSLPGRLQTIAIQERTIILDVAHNPAAAQNLCLYLQQNPIAGQTWAIASMMFDKDRRGVFNELAPQIQHWLLCDLDDNPRAASAVELYEDIQQCEAVTLQGCGIHTFPNVADSIAWALKNSSAHDRIIIFGSFFTVAEAQSTLDAVES